jgi:hypothetical protein
LETSLGSSRDEEQNVSAHPTDSLKLTMYRLVGSHQPPRNGGSISRTANDTASDAHLPEEAEFLIQRTNK